MSTFPGYRAISVGGARVIDRAPYSDGTTARQIHNFNIDENGNLDSTFRIMPLIGSGHVSGGGNPWSAGIPIAMYFGRFQGEVPELVFITDTNVRRYAPWLRGDAGGPLETLYEWRYSRTGLSSYERLSVQPIDKRTYPPQFEQIGDHLYFTLGDGAGCYVWDRTENRIRRFGFQAFPGTPGCDGPSPVADGSSNLNNNDGGFSVPGRIGTISGNLFTNGGVDAGEWKYAVVFEGPTGAISAPSPLSASVRMEREEAASTERLNDLGKKFRVMSIPQGPDGTVARHIYRTPNLKNLPPGREADLYWAHRLPGNISTEWIDDVPDGELGSRLVRRMGTPQGFHFLKFFNGSLFVMGTTANQSRVWWSEQGSVNGPTPESFLEGHWRDVYPSTGPIRGSHIAQMPNDSADAMIVVFKERGCHFITGRFPDWSFGTLHESAGLCGPDLVQSTPDGAVVWYGSGTFWRLSRDGVVQDIGEPIRDLLRRVDDYQSRNGSSWVDQRLGEARFVLSMDDSGVCKYQFIWDYRRGGWRTAESVAVESVVHIDELDLTIASGSYDGTDSVWCLGRGVPSDSYTVPEAVYQSGWVASLDRRSPPHSVWSCRHVSLSMVERGNGTVELKGYKDHNETDVVDSFNNVPASNPESGGLSYYRNTSTNPVNSAKYGEDRFRIRRNYVVGKSLDIPRAEVVSVKVSGTEPFCITDIHLHGPKVANPGGSNPRSS